MWNATKNQPLDFKTTNGTNQRIYTTPEGRYRGMPLDLKGDDPSLPVYASGRDVGNIAAGIVAGRNGMSWSTARLGYDALQSYSKGKFTKEAASTQYGQKLGHRIGSQMYKNAVQSRLPGNGHIYPSEISKNIIRKNDL